MHAGVLSLFYRDFILVHKIESLLLLSLKAAKLEMSEKRSVSPDAQQTLR